MNKCRMLSIRQTTSSQTAMIILFFSSIGGLGPDVPFGKLSLNSPELYFAKVDGLLWTALLHAVFVFN